MPIIMARVDERLIHGQMALSWLRSYGADCVIVIDDASARDAMKKMLLEMALSGTVRCVVCDEVSAKETIEKDLDKRLFLCTGKPSVFLNLLRAGVSIPQINIGGIYNKPDRKQYYKTVFLDEATKQDILSMEAFPTAKIEYRQVPQDFEVDIIGDLKK